MLLLNHLVTALTCYGFMKSRLLTKALHNYQEADRPLTKAGKKMRLVKKQGALLKPMQCKILTYLVLLYIRCAAMSF